MSIISIIWPLEFFAKLLDYCAKHVRWIGLAMAFLAWVTGFIKACITDTLTRLSGYLDAINLDNFQNVSFATLELVGYANAIVPISEFITLMTAYLVAWLTVITVRWIKSFVPTVAN
jgi:hypothetical protein